MGDKDLISGDQIAELGLTDWRPIMGWLQTRFLTGDFATGLRLVNAVAEAAEAANHHPDIDLRYPHVDVSLSSHDVGGKTSRDVELARTISGLAADLGVPAAPEAAMRVDWGLDSWDHSALLPFWNAVLGLTPSKQAPEEVFDPSGAAPSVWFQDTDEHQTPRQRWHPDVWVPPEVASARVAAALDAGGTIADDSQAPRFTVLADPQGNRVCLCTHVGRSH